MADTRDAGRVRLCGATQTPDSEELDRLRSQIVSAARKWCAGSPLWDVAEAVNAYELALADAARRILS